MSKNHPCSSKTSTNLISPKTSNAISSSRQKNVVPKKITTPNGTTNADGHMHNSADGDISDLVHERLPSSNCMIRGQNDLYAVGRVLASGKYGAVYEVLRRRDGRMFAAKLEVCDISTNALSNDYIVLKAANNSSCTHFCNLLDRGKIEGHFKFLVMKKVGDNLHTLIRQFQHQRFSAPTSLRLALEMLESLEQLHSLGFVHRDVKPSNFCIHDEDGKTKIYLIDFGLCRQFRLPTGEMKPFKKASQFRGTPRYAPLSAHRGDEQSTKDDIESWLYVIIEFMTGELPWTDLHDRDTIKKLKEEARSTDGCINLLKYCPRVEFRKILNYLDGLKYGSQVDYKLIKQTVQMAMKNNDIRVDEPYDWQQADESD